jgi:DNA-directed RNA polymerase specialized sigma24 family protein
MHRRSALQLEEMDPVLRPYLLADDEAEAERLLGDLMEAHAQPLIRQIAHSKLHVGRSASTEGSSVQDAHDVCSEVVLQLLNRLRDLRDGPDQSSILNFRSYVAAVTYHACGASLRRKYPERQRLKNRLRYVLNHDPRFALWEDANGMFLSGLVDWKSSNCSTFPVRPAAAETFEQSLQNATNLRQLPPRALLDAVFALSGMPIEIEELVGLVAKIWDLQELRQVENDASDGGGIWNRLPDPRVNVALLVERRMYLAALWKEICELRPLQRAAVLLNLHESSGHDMLPLLIMGGVASFSEIAAALDMHVQDLAELWDSLPLDDATLAERLGITRQQVINLRKSARERLARRMTKSW